MHIPLKKQWRIRCIFRNSNLELGLKRGRAGAPDSSARGGQAAKFYE
jgi:hypothetical protein